MCLRFFQGINSTLAYNNAQKSQPFVTMPICPDVKMKRLPFYEIISELIKPTSLLPCTQRLQEASFPFCLTPQEAGQVAQSKEYVAISMGDQKLQYTTQVYKIVISILYLS